VPSRATSTWARGPDGFHVLDVAALFAPLGCAPFVGEGFAAVGAAVAGRQRVGDGGGQGPQQRQRPAVGVSGTPARARAPDVANAVPVMVRSPWWPVAYRAPATAAPVARVPIGSVFLMLCSAPLAFRTRAR